VHHPERGHARGVVRVGHGNGSPVTGNVNEEIMSPALTADEFAPETSSGRSGLLPYVNILRANLTQLLRLSSPAARA
jgi:hypothetical protein